MSQLYQVSNPNVTLLLHAEEICSTYGVYGLRVDISGELEGLVIGPDTFEWTALGELPVVQAGTSRPTKVRRS